MQQHYDRLLLDPIERGETAAEREFDRMLQSDGRLKCACGNLFDPEKEGATLSPDPYAMPFCDSCCAAAFPNDF